MRPHAAIGFALLITLTLTARAGHDPTITDEIAPGVRATFKHRIIVEEETWPSALMETRAGRAMLELEHAGGFRLHVRIREHPGDYLICVLYLDEAGRLILDETTRFAFRYGEREVESVEILLTDGPAERRVFSTREMTVALREDSTMYAKVRSGGYLAAVRFAEGSLPEGDSWVPDSFELRRGGEGHEDAHDEGLAGASGGGDVAGRLPGGFES